MRPGVSRVIFLLRLLHCANCLCAACWPSVGCIVFTLQRFHGLQHGGAWLLLLAWWYDDDYDEWHRATDV